MACSVVPCFILFWVATCYSRTQATEDRGATPHVPHAPTTALPFAAEIFAEGYTAITAAANGVESPSLLRQLGMGEEAEVIEQRARELRVQAWPDVLDGKCSLYNFWDLSVEQLLTKLDASIRFGAGIVHHPGHWRDLDFESMYKAAYVMVTKGAAQLLYDRIVQIVEEALGPDPNCHKATFGTSAMMMRDVLSYLRRPLAWSDSNVAANRDYVAAHRPPAYEARLEALFVRMKSQAHWARLKPKAARVGRIALFVDRLFNEVHYRPGARGAKRCREEFEAAAALDLE